MTPREVIIEKVNQLFIYTDNRQWQQLLEEVFAEDVLFDISSVSGVSASLMKAKDICITWHNGFKNLDAVHHQAGNFLVKITGETAEAFCYAIAWHYKKAAYHGKTREFAGSYEIG